jgi:class 3 adenylate cyclase/pimeloyl-ACP methyl ester carboxylesterase
VQQVTRYAVVDGARVAYQAFGEGSPTIVAAAGTFTNTDVAWEDPGVALFLTRLASLGTVVRYDRLGTSNSDPLPPDWDPSPAAFARELDAVLDAAGRTDEIVLMSWLDAGPFAIHYAATHPDRVQKLILYNTTARFLEADDYDIGLTTEWFDDLFTHIDTLWGTDAQVALNVPSRLGDARFAAWYGKLVRSLGTPTTIAAILRDNLTADVRAQLAQLHLPTLVMHRAEYGLIPAAHGRYLADHIDGAQWVELPGADGPMFWEASDLILSRIRSFIGRDASAPEQQFATILFSDIVRSTEMAESLGDRAWSALIEVHRAIAEDVVEGRRGRLVKSTGDGILAVFPDPASALAAAVELRAKLDEMGVRVRVGLHSGRIEVAADCDVSGVAVHIAARVMATADDGEIVVSRTVRDLMLGADTKFRDLGPHGLKGVDGEWELYVLESVDG